ncbi:MAG: hypothetical protein ABIG44_00350 [Planctomycetota bacterium]
MMLAELGGLLAFTPSHASPIDYIDAVVEDNTLAKNTASGRRLTAKRLSELYALNPRVPLFRVLRFFWDAEEAGRPLLACLCACARDPLLRATASHVLSTRAGELVTRMELEELIESSGPGRFRPTTRKSIAQNVLSSWTQSGHLEGRRVKKRRSPVVTPGNTAYALFVGYLSGIRGPMLFDTFWAGLLDATTEELHAMSAEASRREWLDYKRLGAVVEVGFNGLLTKHERELVHGQD